MILGGAFLVGALCLLDGREWERAADVLGCDDDENGLGVGLDGPGEGEVEDLFGFLRSERI